MFKSSWRGGAVGGFAFDAGFDRFANRGECLEFMHASANMRRAIESVQVAEEVAAEFGGDVFFNSRVVAWCAVSTFERV